MAKATVANNTTSTTNQLAAYREQARALRGARKQPGAPADSSIAITAGKAMAASRNFFSIAADVYAVERAPYIDQ